MVITKFVVRKVDNGQFICIIPNQDGTESISGTVYAKKAKTFDTYPEAETFLDTLESGFYQIDKLFYVKK